jgi:hypothetical protein
MALTRGICYNFISNAYDGAQDSPRQKGGWQTHAGQQNIRRFHRNGADKTDTEGRGKLETNKTTHTLKMA